MIPEETKKRLEEAANKYCKDYGRTGEINGYDVTAFTHGAKWMFKEAGGDMVMHEMRRMIIHQVKEWMKWNAQPKYIFIEDGQPWIDNAKLLADFEADMNKLWEGEGCSE